MPVKYGGSHGKSGQEFVLVSTLAGGLIVVEYAEHPEKTYFVKHSGDIVPININYIKQRSLRGFSFGHHRALIYYIAPTAANERNYMEYTQPK